MYQQNK